MGGSDTLDGGGGADVMNGGRGRDVFVFDDALNSGPDARDVLRGSRGAIAFEKAGAGRGDRIDLSGIDADMTEAGIQQFEFGRGASAGTVWATNEGRKTVICASVDGDDVADLEIVVFDGSARASAYSAADFIV